MAGQGWIVFLDGASHGFATSGVTAGGSPTPRSTAASEWPLTTGVTILDGWLDEKEFKPRLRSRLRTAGGGLEVGPLTFPIHDLPSSSAPFNGAGVATWLFTRDPSVILQATELASDLTSTTATFNVVDAAQLPGSTPFVVWIEREAMRVDSVFGNALTVTRGWYGSRAVPHAIDYSANLVPAVYADYPWATRRRVTLWRVGSDGVAWVRWRGYVQGAPRGARGAAQIELAAEGCWQGLYSQLRAGDPRLTCALTGFNGAGFALIARDPNGTLVGGALASPAAAPVFASAELAWADAAHRQRTSLATAYSPTTCYVAVRPDGAGGWQATAILDGGTSPGSFTLIAQMGDARATATSTAVVGKQTAQLTLPGAPDALMAFDPTTSDNSVAVDYAVGLASWAQPSGSPWTDAGTVVTSIAPVLRGALSDDQWLVLAPGGTHSVDPNGGYGATLTTAVRVLPRKPTGLATIFKTPRGLALHKVFVPGAVQLRYAARVVAGHWLYAFKRALGETTVVRDQADPRDFDFDTTGPAIVDATGGPQAATELYLDGTDAWGKLLGDRVAADGVALGLGVEARITPVLIAPPIRGTAADLTIAVADLDRDHDPEWEQLGDELVTGVHVTAEGLDLAANNQGAVGRFGKGQTPEIALTGANVARAAIANPVAFAQQALARLAAWERPLSAVTFHVSDARFGATIVEGTTIDLSLWLVPDLTGGRRIGSAAALAALGTSTQRGTVVGRDLDGDALAVTVVVWPVWRVAIAPCCRVASISTNVLTIAGPGYADGSDYAGSDDAAYAGTANDGGVSKFAIGDAVELIRRDVAVYTAWTSTVTGVNPAGPTLTLAGSPPGAWATYAKVDVRGDHFAACTVAQQQYAHCASSASPYVIDSTTTKARTFG